MRRPPTSRRHAAIAGLSLIVLALLLPAVMACQGPQDPASVATPTREPAATSLAAATPSATATATTTPSPTPVPSATPEATPAASPTDVANQASPAATPSAPALPVGQKQTYANGTTVIVHAVEPASGGISGVQLGPNDHLLTIDVEVCAGAQVTDLTVSSTQVMVDMPNGSSYPGLSTGRTPLLSSQGILPGACTRGWATVQLPKTPNPSFVAVALKNYEPASWVFPGS